MPASQDIRDALQQVSAARHLARASLQLSQAVTEVKKFQAQRFSATYQDLLASELFGQCASFFLEELYSERDYSKRDAQFAKVATAIEMTFPDAVIETTVKLAQLHSTTESLDLQMAQLWSNCKAIDPSIRYLDAWRQLDCRQRRLWQLETVLEIGQELGKLTRKRGLKLLLKMMQQPAKLAGLGNLQQFLESGFDHFAQLSKNKSALTQFLVTIQSREQDWINRLETMERCACEQHIKQTLAIEHNKRTTGKHWQ